MLIKKPHKYKKFIPFGQPSISKKEITAVTKVLNSAWLGHGNEVFEFEKEIENFLNTKNIISVNSCTSALFLSLSTLNLKINDEIIVPSLTWTSTVNAIIHAGGTPVFCDVDSDTLSVDINSILKTITPKTKAVVIVHFGGLAFDVKSLRKLLPKGIIIIEDAAHAFGSKYKDGSFVGDSKNLTCFSFYGNKNLAIGDGGAISAPNKKTADFLYKLSNQGMPHNAWQRYSNLVNLITPEIKFYGYKMNMVDVLASLGKIQLRRQNTFAIRRLHIAKQYVQLINDIDCGINFQTDILHEYHSRHLFVIKLPSRVNSYQLVRDMRENNIGASIHYRPVHTHPPYKKFSRSNLMVTNNLDKNIITLPIGPMITSDEVSYVVENLNYFIRKKNYGRKI